MTPLTSKIEKLSTSEEFKTFIKTFGFDHMYYDERIIIHNKCYICKIYTEYGYPYFDIYNIVCMKRTVNTRIIDDISPEILSIKSNILNKQAIDIIDNLSALTEFYLMFEAFTKIYPDLFDCIINKKYIDMFEPFDPEHYGIDKILKTIKGREKIN